MNTKFTEAAGKGLGTGKIKQYTGDSSCVYNDCRCKYVHYIVMYHLLNDIK